MTIIPISGEPFRFHCESDSGETYLLDLEDGRCNCRHYECFIAPRIKMGLLKGQLAMCKHLRMAWLEIGPLLIKNLANERNKRK
ncbi:MAG: hypothetical protein RLY20_1282 [Verrucomicrobiota bacterium]|jgi:hypothetical protein